jgi:hypothetical protein
LLRLSAQRERENFNYALFAFAFFSRRQDRELLGAISRGLLDVHVEFKVHRSCETSYTADFLIKKLPPPRPDRYERRLFPPEHFWKTRSAAMMGPLQKIAPSGTRWIYV